MVHSLSNMFCEDFCSRIIAQHGQRRPFEERAYEAVPTSTENVSFTPVEPRGLTHV